MRPAGGNEGIRKANRVRIVNVYKHVIIETILLYKKKNALSFFSFNLSKVLVISQWSCFPSPVFTRTSNFLFLKAKVTSGSGCVFPQLALGIESDNSSVSRAIVL